MKNYFLIVAGAAFSLFTSLPDLLFAQSKGSAGVSVTIVTPNTLEKTSDLRFVVSSGEIADRRISPNTKIPVIAAAGFVVSGAPDFLYGITAPSYVTISARAGRIRIDTKECSTAPNRTLSKEGRDMLFVEGAAITFSADSTCASKDNSYAVTVVYN